MQCFQGAEKTSHRKYYKEGLNLSAVQTLLRPHALYSGIAVKPVSAGGTGAGLFQLGAGIRRRRLRKGGSARRSAASEVSVQQQQPASSGAGSPGQKTSLPKRGGSLRPCHLQNFCSRIAYRKTKESRERGGKLGNTAAF